MEHETTTAEERGNVNSNTPSIEMSEKRISMGINVSILVILTIFGVLLSLPLRLLLNTNYYSRDEIVAASNETSVQATGNSTVEEEITIPFDHRRLKRCPRFEYENTLKYIFKSDYDGNCTYDTGTSFATIGNDWVEENIGGKEEEEEEEESLKKDGNEGRNEEGTGTRILREIGKSDNKTDKVEESGEDRRSKSVLVAGHILVTMLLISAIAALVEVLRIRFARDKDSSKAGSISRKTSTIELPIQRRFLPRYPIKSTKSFEMHRSAFRLLGARPPPLIRRSSFPIQQSKQSSGSVSGTPNNRISRRQSAESDEEIGVLINALHHRTRLIRRH